MDDRSLAEYFADLARRLSAAGSVDETMRLLVAAAIETRKGCEHAAIGFRRGKALVCAASSDHVAETIDSIQTEAQEGPCLEAIRTGEIQTVSDLAHDARWPRFATLALEATDVHSSVAYPLLDGDKRIGSLSLFARAPGALDHDPQQDGEMAILTAHASVALDAALHRQDMAAALENRDLIGQAKGLLMARSGVDAEEAFAILARASQRMNLRLVDVARHLVAGDLATQIDPTAQT